MEGEDGGDTPPFWLQSNSSNNNRNRRRSSSNFFLNSGFLIIILAITALFLVFIAVPSFLSFTSQYIKPHLVKKNWDSLNIVLVFFAIICGFLSRRTADDIPAGSGADNGFSNLSSQRALAEEGEREPNQMQFRHRPMSMDQRWIGYSDMNPVTYNSDNLSSLSSTTGNVGGMRRNSSSYPDLRRESLWNPGPERRRFYDDINVDGYQYGGAPDYLHRRHPSDPLPAPVPTEYQYGESNYLLHHNSAPVPATVPESDDTKYFGDTKTIPVDTFVVRQQDESSPEPPPVIEPTEQPPPPPQPPPPAAGIRRKERAERRTFRSVERREEPAEEKKELEFEKVRTRSLIPPPSPPPPAPPPPPPPKPIKPLKSEQKSSKSERKRSGNAAKDIKNTFASLYNQRKNKRKNKQKSKESFDDMFHQLFDEPAAAQSFVGPPLPPPPPPPPPASVFHQLFKKSSKTKKIHSDAAPSPPPTKPSGSSKRRVQNHEPSPSMPENSAPKQVRSPLKPDSSPRKKPSTPGKPPLPASRSSNNYFTSDELYSNSGNQSPLIPMPPPPPPPPFKMSAMQFVVRGDFVRIRSRKSRSGSPELLDDAASAQESPMDTPISTPRVVDSTDGESSIPPSPFFPSPDVDYKADSFIARFRAGLKNGN